MTPCILWSGHATPEGYGRAYSRMSDPAGRKFGYGAHRLVWERANGQRIPDGFEIDHLCRNPRCVNLEHLEVVTHDENMRRRREFAFCRKGHAFNSQNTIWTHNGKSRTRRCRVCRDERYARKAVAA